MSTFTYILIFSLLGGVFSLCGGVLLLRSKKSADKLALYATPFAGGALLAAVFLDLLVEGIEVSEAYTVLLSTLLGVLSFFLLEGFLHWFHHHHEHPSKEKDATTSLIVVGDTLHNALDGVAIAVAFLISVPTGIVTTFAVAMHEIPQEIGDFGLLLSKGMERRKVLLVNLLSALATTIFAVITFVLGDQDKLPLGVLFGFSAGFLLYIAMSDIIPTIHSRKNDQRKFRMNALLLVLGVVVVGLAISLTHNYIDTGHSHDEELKNCVTYLDKDGETVLWQDCEDEDHLEDSDHDDEHDSDEHSE